MDVEKTIEFILEQQAQVETHLAAMAEQHLKLRQDLNRAVRLGIQEARAERRRRREMDERLDAKIAVLDEKITQLAAAQLVTEEKLQRLIDFQQGGNGRA